MRGKKISTGNVFFISLTLNSQSSNDIKKQNSRQCGELKFRSQE